MSTLLASAFARLCPWFVVAGVGWIAARRDRRHRPLSWLLGSFALIAALEEALPEALPGLEASRALALAVVVPRVFGVVGAASGFAPRPTPRAAALVGIVVMVAAVGGAALVEVIALIGCWVCMVVGIVGALQAPHVVHLILIFLVVDQSVAAALLEGGHGLELVRGIDRLSQAACLGACLGHLRGGAGWSSKPS